MGAIIYTIHFVHCIQCGALVINESASGIVLSTLFCCMNIVEKGTDMRGEWCVCVCSTLRQIPSCIVTGRVLWNVLHSYV